MYQISQFSKISGVPIQTLRYYDNLLLLKPKLIGVDNNYRYYSKEQLVKLMVIKKMKKMGFKLNEIKEISKFCDENVLDNHKKRLQDEINSRIEHLRDLELIISKVKNGKQNFEQELINLINSKERSENVKEKYSQDVAKLRESYKMYQEKNFEGCMTVLEELKKEIFYSPESLDPFWDNSAGDLFLGITFEVFKNNSSENVNFLNIFDFRIKDISQMDNMVEYVAKLDRDSYSSICFSSIANLPLDTRLAIISVFKQLLKPYAMRTSLNIIE